MTGPSKPAITSEQLRVWIERRHRFRKRVKLVVVSLLAAVVAALAVGWTFFHRQLLAVGSLQSLGFTVDWDINYQNLFSGGRTTVAFAPRNVFAQSDEVRAGDLESLKSLSHLESLDLSGLDRLGDDDLGVIASLGELEDLQLNRESYPSRVDDHHVTLTDRVLDHVRGLTQLKTLGLAGNRITDAGLARLADLRALEGLDLDGTLVTDAGLAALTGLKGLRMLRVENTPVTREGVARFQQARPDVEVISEPYPLSTTPDP